MGNFMQFSLMNDIPLYAPNIWQVFAFAKTMQKKIIKNSLWENVVTPTNTIILIEQMCQSKDEQYASLLQNICDNKFSKVDFKLLKTWFLSNLNVNLSQPP
jgi:hypothetical protein